MIVLMSLTGQTVSLPGGLQKLTASSRTTSVAKATLQALLWQPNDNVTEARSAIGQLLDGGNLQLTDTDTGDTITSSSELASFMTGGGSNVAPGAIIRVGSAQSPYTPSPQQTVIVDTSTGSVVIDLPVLLPGQYVTVQQDANTSMAVNGYTVNAPAGWTVQQLPPNNGSFSGSVVVPNRSIDPTGAASLGEVSTWYNGGSGNDTLLVR
jgi:hypothetical protein